jgi:hypothetical protein
MKAAGYKSSGIESRPKGDVSHRQELCRTLDLLTDKELVKLFNTNKLGLVLELIYDPLLLTDKSRRLLRKAFKKTAPKFLRDRLRLKDLFDKAPSFSVDMALAYKEELVDHTIKRPLQERHNTFHPFPGHKIRPNSHADSIPNLKPVPDSTVSWVLQVARENTR